MRTITVCVLLAASVLAQNAAPPAFEVASVKISQDYRPDDRSTWQPRIDRQPSGITLRNIGLPRVIAMAYHVQIPLVVAPGWMDGQRYEIVGKAGKTASEDEIASMLQALLAERFRLATHRETRSMQVLAMLPGKDGSHKLTPSANTGPARPRQDPQRGPMIEGAALSDLSEELARDANLPVVNLTGLNGRYDFVFNPARYVNSIRARYAADPNRPEESEMRFTLYDELLAGDLGLRLERRKMDVEVLVVDRCEKTPAEN